MAVTTAYDGLAREWDAAAGLVYRPLARSLVAASPVALAGFLLNHLPPAAALAELARVVRPGGVVLASTWAGGQRDAAKAAIDAVVADWGWIPPAWYQAMQEQAEQASGNPERLAATARQAGLVSVRAWVHREDLGLLDSHAVVAYRLATPQIAPWVGALDPPARAELVSQALVAVRPLTPGWRPAAVLLAGRVSSQSS